MDWIIAMGCSCLGILIGNMVRRYITTSQTVGFAVLTGAVSILGGGGVSAIFSLLQKANAPIPHEYWFYPTGLLLGYMVTSLLEPERTRKQKAAKVDVAKTPAQQISSGKDSTNIQAGGDAVVNTRR